MGDLIHLFPALTCVKKKYPHIIFDWVVEKSFIDIVKLHPAVNKVIPVSLREWRQNLFVKKTFSEVKYFLNTLREVEYDYIIDAQGLLKSAMIGRSAKGKRIGFHRLVLREKLARLFYQQEILISSHHHAIHRNNALFSEIFDIDLKEFLLDFGIKKQRFGQLNLDLPKTYVVFLHGTTWETKHLPRDLWYQLATYAIESKVSILLPWSNQNELECAQDIRNFILEHYGAKSQETAPVVLPKLSLSDMVTIIGNAKGVLAVDTGLGHLAGALEIPVVSMYGATSPAKTGAMGKWSAWFESNQACAPCLKRQCVLGSREPFPCYRSFSPGLIWKELNTLVAHAAKI